MTGELRVRIPDMFYQHEDEGFIIRLLADLRYMHRVFLKVRRVQREDKPHGQPRAHRTKY
jgi:hypothetical protein